MTAKLTLDKAGRVVIPKRLRDQLHLAPGDAFEAESAGEEIVLRPVRQELSLRKKHGIWVAYGGPPLSAEMTDAVLQSIRDERDAQNLGDM
jgi:AbrB family looped-hinge helix DNA binding protein